MKQLDLPGLEQARAVYQQGEDAIVVWVDQLVQVIEYNEKVLVTLRLPGSVKAAAVQFAERR